MNGSGDDRLRNDDATSIASYHIIAISPIGFRHYNLFYIYRSVSFLTLWLPSRHSPIRELPFWTSLFLSARVAVLDVDVRIMTSSVMAQQYTPIEFEKSDRDKSVKHTKVPSTATNITKPSGEYTHPIP